MRKLILAILGAFVLSALPPATADAAQASDTQQILAGKKGKDNARSRAARKKKNKLQKKKQKRAAKKAAKKAERKAARKADRKARRHA